MMMLMSLYGFYNLFIPANAKGKKNAEHLNENGPHFQSFSHSADR